MKPHTDSSGSKSPQKISTVSVLVARLLWVAVGPIALVLTTIGIAVSATGWATGRDAFFAGTVGAILLGRWIEYRSGAGMDMTGEPTTRERFTRYMYTFPMVALALWIIAKVLGNHLLN